MATVSDRWVFCGDVNLEHGGAFIDLSTWDDGYCSAVRMTDLDGGCGFAGACLIEHVVILGTTDNKRIRDALRCVGGLSSARNWSSGDKASIKQALRHAIADALLSYGYFDPDSEPSEVVQMESDGPMVFDGWKADKRLRGTTLEDYVASVHLNN